MKTDHPLIRRCFVQYRIVMFVLLVLGFFVSVASDCLWASEPSFSREILPILSDRCLACHGPDETKREADLRLDTREGATAHVIVPGKPAESELLRRIMSNDPDEVMPPPGHTSGHKQTLTASEIDKLRRWIESGAPWGKHWAFEKPMKVKIPDGVHPVDALVEQRLAQEGLSLAREADRHTLLRRLSFDLTGLPPTPAELAATDSYEAHVDRLLASPHFGERMAMWWLDASRYSDTDGFQADANRENWPWRDWVVEAFNANMRFDQFTLEQFAGDLLPDATEEQKLATCFHRNHMTNGEGGRDPEESRVDYVLDRVNTMGTTYLGLTLNCCQCHSHKFDPVTQADYYGLTAFFNSIDEDGKAGKGAKPYLKYESKYVQRAVEEAQRLVDERKPVEQQAKSQAQQPFEDWLNERKTEVQSGFTAWHPLVGKVEATEGTVLQQADDGTVQATGPNPNQDDYRVIGSVSLARVTGIKLEVFTHESHTNGAFSRGAKGEFILTDIKVQVRRRGSSQIRDLLVNSAAADYSPDQKEKRAYGDVKGLLDDDPRNGWTTEGAESIQPHVAVFALAEPLVIAEDEELIFEMLHRSTNGDANIGRFRVSITDQRGPAVASVEAAPLEQLAKVESVSDELRQLLFEQFLSDHEPYQIAKKSLDRAQAQLKEAKAAKQVEVMVLAEKPEPRETFVLLRGVWDKHGDPVRRAGLPSILPLQGESLNRVDLARWLTSPEHPLTSRVLVNHLWQICFGTGLVRTTEDFGLQGEQPTHPELLDWLAVECLESGWDIKHLLKLIVTSKTYRQSSQVSGELLARDPENRLLARGARYRLPAWMLRDAALQSAGLLNPALGGPPVKPYQPEGVWEENFMGRFTYVPSEGAAQYRRTLYAFWRRSIAPTFLFDSAQRRACEVRTSRTNTPLHALTLMNDENFLEASRALAVDVMKDPDPLRQIMQRVLSRPPSDNEYATLVARRDRAVAYYREHPDQALKFLNRGQTKFDEDAATPDLAAYTVIASLVFNLDEAMTHE